MRFDIRDGKDVRVVTGHKSYVQRPKRNEPTLWIDSEVTLDIQLDAQLAGDVQIVDAHFILFTCGNKRPEMLDATLTRDGNGGVRVATTQQLDPKKGHDAFKLLLKLTGDGSATFSNLTFAKHGSVDNTRLSAPALAVPNQDDR